MIEENYKTLIIFDDLVNAILENSAVIQADLINLDEELESVSEPEILEAPSSVPSSAPSPSPSAVPTLSIKPSSLPTLSSGPTLSSLPTVIPSDSPTAHPSISPSSLPSDHPSIELFDHYMAINIRQRICKRMKSCRIFWKKFCMRHLKHY